MNARLGIIGGGQLGLYLCEAAQSLGIKVSVISETEDAPALQRADTSFLGEIDSIETLDQFLANSDVIIFDKEAIPDDTLTYLIDAEKHKHIAVHPHASIISMLKDKARQKTWLCEQDLPTLPFHIIAGNNTSLSTLTEMLGQSLVQKVRCGGYDGRGVQILKGVQSADQLWDVPSIVEPYLPNCREISIITARAQTGEMQTYPPVSMEFDPHLNAVSVVSMPAAISPQLAQEAIELAERAVTQMDGIGIFAIEMFITPEGKLLINEIAPRVHNSGHVTQVACNVSQFEQHIRAVMGLPLVTVRHKTPAAMLNILYTEAIRDSCPEKPGTQKLPGLDATVYWYGKLPGSIGRKMGHINAVAPTVEDAVGLANRALAKLAIQVPEQVI